MLILESSQTKIYNENKSFMDNGGNNNENGERIRKEHSHMIH